MLLKGTTDDAKGASLRRAHSFLIATLTSVQESTSVHTKTRHASVYDYAMSLYIQEAISLDKASPDEA